MRPNWPGLGGSAILSLIAEGSCDRRTFELDPIALRIQQIDRGSLAIGAEAHAGFLDRHAMSPQMIGDRSSIERVNAQAEVIDVMALATRRRPAAAAKRPRHIDEIDQGPSGTQMQQAEILAPALDAAADDLAIEALQRRHAPYAEHDMVEAEEGEGRSGHGGTYT